ncbi:MAG TPA: hypothetical protein VHE35_02990 [Kofleriaceae bacterium]|nr:hypothetical protein [Kofleriaceae bacterium]
MAYSIDLADAARRHMEAAHCLYECDPPCRRRDVAAYLYGLSAEMALKRILQCSVPRRHHENKHEDPMYAHFPGLKTLLRDNALGRYGAILRRFAEDDALMNEWDIAMRYAPRKDLVEKQVDRWREHAQRAVREMENV